MGGPDHDRNSRAKFRKRCKTLKSKAHQLAYFCDANVYLFIDHPRACYVYNSADDSSWPPPDEVLVGIARPTAGITKLSDRQELHYPNLERKTFKEMERLQEGPSGDLKRLTQYFATRLELLHSLEGFYNDTDPAHEVTEEEA